MVGGYGELAFQFGLLDENQKLYVDQQCETAVASIREKDFYNAFKVKMIR